MTGIIAGLTLVAPTIQAVMAGVATIQSAYALFQKGDITEAELLAKWKAAGVNVQLADANLQAAMDEARRNQA